MTLLIGRTNDIAACLSLRRAVFIDEQGVPEADEIDDRDGTAIHVLARQDGMAVGTARLFAEPPLGTIGRVCVLRAYRGTGLGRRIMEQSLALLKAEDGIAEITLGAQTHALDFYRALGFEAEGPVYDDAGIPHRKMRLTL